MGDMQLTEKEKEVLQALARAEGKYGRGHLTYAELAPFIRDDKLLREVEDGYVKAVRVLQELSSKGLVETKNKNWGWRLKEGISVDWRDED